MYDWKITEKGVEIEFEDYYLLFGNKNLKYEEINGFLKDRLKKKLIKSQSLHQVHGDQLVPVKAVKKNEPEGDSSYTFEKNFALIIKTADCIPILGFDPKSELIFAVHAGWRGIENRILQKGLSKFQKYYNVRSPQLFFGPFIRKSSFVVRTDVLDKIKNVYSLYQDVHYKVLSEDQFQLDIFGPLREELISNSYPSDFIWDSKIDTFKDPNFNSYRRDRHKSSRNYSIIIRK